MVSKDKRCGIVVMGKRFVMCGVCWKECGRRFVMCGGGGNKPERID